MPVKLSSRAPLENTEARIEIIPLIDIMFFLLASFMLVSLSMVNLKTVKVNLPASTTSIADSPKNFVDLSVDQSGAIYLDKKPVAGNELARSLAAMRMANANLRLLISGDVATRHGDMIHVLDLVHSAGIDNVAFEVTSPARSANP